MPERAALSNASRFGITRNVSRDGRAASDVSYHWPRSELNRIDDACTADPLRQMVTVETGARCAEHSARIPVKYREVVILCDLHDLSRRFGAILRTSMALCGRGCITEGIC